MTDAPYAVTGIGQVQDRPPVVAAIPHGGRQMPTRFAQTLRVAPESLWADWYTDELWRFLPLLGVSLVKTPLSRFVADPNRDPESGYGNFWSSVVPANDPMGDPVHSRALTGEEVDVRVATAHTPFHRLLEQGVLEVLSAHERAVVLDLHSFGVPLDADVIIGDVDGTTSSPVILDAAVTAFVASGFRVEVNLRFRGGWTVRNVSRNARVDALSIEINQRAYLAEHEVDAWPNAPSLDPERLSSTAERLQYAMREFIGLLASTLAAPVTPVEPGQ